MRLLQERPVAPETVDAEALIQEARRLRRRRWLVGLSVLVIAGAASGIGYSLAASRGVPSRRLAPANGNAARKGTTTSATAVAPKQPAALAIGPNGNLYLADIGRHQILERLTSGRFKVVAGNGRSGFSGDGGPAIDAEIDGPESLAITASGDLYFSQAGRLSGAGGMLNMVIREVAPDGKITTVAGLHPNCSVAQTDPHAISAQDAEFDGALLSIGPNGDLNVETTVCPNVLHLGSVLQLTPTRKLIGTPLDSIPAASVDCGQGVMGTNMFVFSCASGGGDTKYGHGPELLVVRSNGSTVAYPDRSQAALLASADGEVVAAHNTSIDRVNADGLQVIASNRQFDGGFSKAIAPLTTQNGLAVNGYGDIYVASDVWVSHQGCAPAIFEINPNGRIKELWHSAPIRLCY